MWHTAVVKTCTLILQGYPLQNFGRVKNVQNSARFLTTFDFDRKYLRNGSTYRKLEKYMIKPHFIPYWAKKIWWTLVHKPKSYRRACWPTQLDFFRETIFRPLVGADPSRPTSPINCISSRTWSAGRPQVGLCPIFSGLHLYLLFYCRG